LEIPCGTGTLAGACWFKEGQFLTGKSARATRSEEMKTFLVRFLQSFDVFFKGTCVLSLGLKLRLQLPDQAFQSLHFDLPPG
jgi:hypothetical protein